MGFLRIAGDYSQWNVYRKSVIVCDVTELFLRRGSLPQGSRTIDQMRQAARSCKQNIVEGCADYTVSTASALKLLGIARGSLRELLEDYMDFLRQSGLAIWSPTDARTEATRAYCRNHDDAARFVAKCSERSDETLCNIMITQIRQLDAMLAGVLKKIETDFLENGGMRESMSRERLKARGR